MARVFRGKIAIPGDQMEAYFEALGQFEQEKAPMRAELAQCAQDFARVLAQQYAPKTVRKHTAIIALFIDFVCWDTDVRRIDEITRGKPIVRSASGIGGKWAIGPKVSSRRRSRSFSSFSRRKKASRMKPS
jgi:hypothetical protein